VDDVEGGAVIAPEDRVAMIGSIRPDGDPAGVVEEGVGIDVGRGVVLALVEGANFHGADLVSAAACRSRNPLYNRLLIRSGGCPSG
jgi:hypothetical protein